MTYTLEPAGSHGVWGLDDHSFMPYIFGSAQYCPVISGDEAMPVEGSLRGSPAPEEITRKATVERYRATNMYFSAVGFINDVKTGPFWEHSPILFDISGVKKGWGKINKVNKLLNSQVHYRKLIMARACSKCSAPKSSESSPSSNISHSAHSSAGTVTQTPHQCRQYAYIEPTI